MYMTDKNQAWSFSSISINDTSSLPGMTLEYFFQDKSDQDESFGYLLYNDQPPLEEFVMSDLLRSSSRGHSKGMLLFSDQSLVWIVHSFPKFPKLDSYKIDPAQCVYGQSMLCMTFDIEELSSVIQQLEFSYPNVYEFRLPASLEQTRPDDYEKLGKMVLGKRGTKEPFGIKDLTTLGGQRFISIYKSSYFAGDLYTGIVAPHFKKSLLVQTWQNGSGGKLESDCSSENENVMNIDEIDSSDITKCAFRSRYDHSKWVVDSEGSMFNCVGDVNRMESQGKRGGGTVCIKNAESAKQYHKLVNSVAPCSQRQKY